MRKSAPSVQLETIGPKTVVTYNEQLSRQCVIKEAV